MIGYLVRIRGLEGRLGQDDWLVHGFGEWCRDRLGF